jgi:PEP-CTERM motif
MKPASLARLCTLALLIGVAPAAHAVSLTFSPSLQTVALGDPVSVDLRVSGLGAGVPPSLSGFDVDVSFDSSILVLVGAQLIAPLGSSAQFSFDVQSTASGAVVNLFALSTLSAAELDALQGDEFTLATLTFATLAMGTSALVLGDVALTDGSGDPLPLDAGFNGQITVPEPATSIGVGLGLFAFALLRRRPRG